MSSAAGARVSEQEQKVIKAVTAVIKSKILDEEGFDHEEMEDLHLLAKQRVVKERFLEARRMDLVHSQTSEASRLLVGPADWNQEQILRGSHTQTPQDEQAIGVTLQHMRALRQLDDENRAYHNQFDREFMEEILACNANKENKIRMSRLDFNRRLSIICASLPTTHPLRVWPGLESRGSS